MIKKYYPFLIPIIVLIGFFGYQQFQSAGVEEINTNQLAEMMNSEAHEDVFYVDVREEHEFNDGHIEGMANVPLSQLENRYEEIPKDQTAVIICRSGNRSMQAINILKDNGYVDLINVKGGMLKWEGNVIHLQE
ncbi:rhodanese-like domain-containing protein [Bacillus shivajii]|uniref:rhodanese-like domain-containing protein n=1 Tax=Bacillus shivajii TaxID=1983719 RepID=UPI001CF96A59|nr:rhodanese-like domain-containing protein [Bacillus shivajii]UCZ51517.1 rhodanese-like domain-containing protein [Bacillus shivajii]